MSSIYGSAAGANVIFQKNNPSVAFGGAVTCTKGADIATEGSGDGNEVANLDQILFSKIYDSAIIGECYDQVAIERSSSATGGNYRLGIYDDTGSTSPNDLLAETASLAIPTANSYTFQTVPEFLVTTTQLWACFMQDAHTSSFRRNNSATTSGNMQYESHVFGSLPATASASSANRSFIMKIGHS